MNSSLNEVLGTKLLCRLVSSSKYSTLRIVRNSLQQSKRNAAFCIMHSKSGRLHNYRSLQDSIASFHVLKGQSWLVITEKFEEMRQREGTSVQSVVFPNQPGIKGQKLGTVKF